MKKLILSIAYTFPVVLLIFALGQNLTTTTTTFKEGENVQKPAIEKKSTDSQQTLKSKQQEENNTKDENSSNDDATYKEDTSSKVNIPPESETCINILLVCTSSDDNNLKNPPDKFSVCSIDSVKDQISFIPIPCDTYVNARGIGYCKLIETYTWGDNTDLLLRTIKSEFGADITKVVEVNTDSVSQIVKTLNEMGIDMTEEKMFEYMNETKVSKAMIEDVKSIPIFKYPKIISCIKPYIKTNMDTASLIKYGITTYKILANK